MIDIIVLWKYNVSFSLVEIATAVVFYVYSVQPPDSYYTDSLCSE